MRLDFNGLHFPLDCLCTPGKFMQLSQESWQGYDRKLALLEKEKTNGNEDQHPGLQQLPISVVKNNSSMTDFKLPRISSPKAKLKRAMHGQLSCQLQHATMCKSGLQSMCPQLKILNPMVMLNMKTIQVYYLSVTYGELPCSSCYLGAGNASVMKQTAQWKLPGNYFRGYSLSNPETVYI